ncbi:MAG: CpXC domain-containing protein [Roseiflexaceae bacterium]|nr:CpXC domain-containing protein [Roseiflexaceae bacterium]
MTASPAQIVQLSCPSCHNPVRAQVFTLVDAGQFPELKSRLLAGQLNVSVCPNCGTPAMISAPVIYHDAAKQLYFVFFPQQLNARPEEQERFIGDTTSLFMRTLPPDAPRSHLLAPRRFLTLNGLIDAVLEADGISKEMIEAQRARVELISQLAEAYEDGEQQLAALVDQMHESLDYEFFTTLTAFVEASAQSGRDDSAALLAGLRDTLLELVGGAPAGPDDQDLGDEDYEDIDLEATIARLIEASDDEVEAIIGEVRPAIDYSFFEEWTRRIDAAEQADDLTTAERLTTRRALVRETVERMDHQAQEMFERGAKILDAVLGAPDMASALREQGDTIDEAFLLVLETHIGAAQRAGREDIVAALGEVQRLATEFLQEQLTPEDRFINELLSAETPQAATRLLRQNPAVITTAFVKRLNELADESEQAGRKPLGERLRQLSREAGAMLF